MSKPIVLDASAWLAVLLNEDNADWVRELIWWKESVRLVREHSLTFYDASYVAVAVVLEMPLLSLDEKILDVMKREKVKGVSP